FYVARARGWYEAAGLDVELRTHDYGWGDTLEYLAEGLAEFGVFPPNRLLVRRERGEPLAAIAAVNHQGLEAIQVARSSGITRPRELGGRRIGYAPTPRGRAMVQAAVAADGGDPGSVVTVDTGSIELTPEFLRAGSVDATFGGYWAWDALTRAIPADATLVWPAGDLGVPRYHSYVLGASAQRSPSRRRRCATSSRPSPTCRRGGWNARWSWWRRPGPMTASGVGSATSCSGPMPSGSRRMGSSALRAGGPVASPTSSSRRRAPWSADPPNRATSHCSMATAGGGRRNRP